MRTKTLAFLAAALAGCTSQANLERNPPMELRTGKSAEDYRTCLVTGLEKDGRHVLVQPQGSSGQRVLVDSKVRAPRRRSSTSGRRRAVRASSCVSRWPTIRCGRGPF